MFFNPYTIKHITFSKLEYVKASKCLISQYWNHQSHGKTNQKLGKERSRQDNVWEAPDHCFYIVKRVYLRRWR